MFFGVPRISEVCEGVLENPHREWHVMQDLAAAQNVTELSRLPFESSELFVNAECMLMKVDGTAQVVLLAVADAELAQLGGLSVEPLQPLVHRQRSVMKADGLGHGPELAVSETQ